MSNPPEDRRSTNKQATIEILADRMSLLDQKVCNIESKIEGQSEKLEGIDKILSVLHDMEAMSRMFSRFYKFSRKLAAFLTFLIPLAIFWDVLKRWIIKILG